MRPRRALVDLEPLSLAAPLAAQPVRQAATVDAPPSSPSAPAVAPVAPAASSVVPGIEVLLADSLQLLRGRRVGLITNHTGRDRSGTSTIDLLHRAPGVRLVALFGPEHGIRGAAQAGEKVASTTDSATGLPVHSLYGAIRVPTPEMLKDIDVLVYDMQDVGARVYTYVWTMALSAEAAGKAGKPFVVLDRPDPIRADRVDGGVLQPKWASFVGQYPVAMRYGLTPGELLRWLVGTGKLKADVRVVPMRGYQRDQWFDATGLPWVNPSPNLRDLDAALVYTGTVYVEGTNLSEGRGTDRPFRLVGAKWLTDAGAIARALNARELAGVRFDSTTRAVEAGQKWGGETIPMVEIVVTDRERVRPAEVGLWLLREIRARHAQQLEWRPAHMDRLHGSDRARLAIDSGDAAVTALLRTLDDESRAFAASTAPYRIYR